MGQTPGHSPGKAHILMDYQQTIANLMRKAEGTSNENEAAACNLKVMELIAKHGAVPNRTTVKIDGKSVTYDGLELDPDIADIIAPAVAPMVVAMGADCMHVTDPQYLLMMAAPAVLDRLAILLEGISPQMMQGVETATASYQTRLAAQKPKPSARVIRNSADQYWRDWAFGYGIGVGAQVLKKRTEQARNNGGGVSIDIGTLSKAQTRLGGKPKGYGDIRKEAIKNGMDAGMRAGLPPKAFARTVKPLPKAETPTAAKTGTKAGGAAAKKTTARAGAASKTSGKTAGKGTAKATGRAKASSKAAAAKTAGSKSTELATISAGS